jgi:hypothetical protein
VLTRIRSSPRAGSAHSRMSFGLPGRTMAAWNELQSRRD